MAMTKHGDGIQAEVEGATVTALANAGPRGIDKNAIVRTFLPSGEVGKSTLYRWIDATIARVKADAEEAARPKPKLAPKPKSVEAEVREVAASVNAEAALAKLVPEIETLEAALGSGRGAVPVTAMLRTVVENVNMLMTHAKTPEGTVRNARLLLQSTDALRRSLETAIRVFQAMRDVDQVDRLIAAMMEEVAKESPAVAGRILRRMDAIAAAWGG